MAYYLVKAKVHGDLQELAERLRSGEVRSFVPFGRALEYSLKNARREEEGTVVWEELDYCSPPLAQERSEVLDDYFDLLEVARVEEGEGWDAIADLPKVFDFPATGADRVKRRADSDD